MKYERTTLNLHTGSSGAFVSTQALRVGDWYVHRRLLASDGLVVSHRVGFRVASQLAPMKAVRLLRALQAVPPAPVDDGELWLFVDGIYPLVEDRMEPWRKQIRAALASVGVAPAKGETRER